MPTRSFLAIVVLCLLLIAFVSWLAPTAAFAADGAETLTEPGEPGFFENGGWVDRNWARLVWAAGFLVAAVLIRLFVIAAIRVRFLRAAERTESPIDDALIKALASPVGNGIVLIGLYFAVYLATNELHHEIRSHGFLVFLDGALGVGFALVLGWAGWRLADVGAKALQKRSTGDGATLDTMMVPIIRRVGRVIVVAIVAVMVIESCGGSIAGVVAGLGIGGVALALASKDLISNFFGSAMIFATRPFKIGDIVEVKDTTGVVRQVGFRSTDIETFDKHKVTIPNQDVANSPIRNISARTSIRNFYTLGLTYDTKPDQMRAVLGDMRNLLDKHEKVADGAIVRFKEFGPSSLDVLVIYHVATTDWNEYLVVTEEVNLAIMDAVGARGLEFAFPTQTIHLAKDAASS